MKILYVTKTQEDCLSDNILYGLRQKFGADLVDFPRKDVMYENCQIPNEEIYGRGFTMWKKLPDIPIDRENIYDRVVANEFDYIFLSSIFRMQDLFAQWTVYNVFRDIKSKFVFLDGEDDGFPTVYDATKRGVYFKRDNPFNYKEIKIIGLSIPEARLLKEKPTKTRLFTTHVQCEEAFRINVIRDFSTPKGPFTKEEDYYHDLAISKFGITMKKSGWDVPRHMENASQWTVNCIYNRAHDQTTWADKPKNVHPLGLEDMKNCVIWDTPEELVAKVQKIETENLYDQIQRGSYDWAKGKTCEAMTDYVLKNI